MKKRDGRNYIVPVVGRCIGCGTCANICPTRIIKIEDIENVRTMSIRDDVIGNRPTMCTILEDIGHNHGI